MYKVASDHQRCEIPIMRIEEYLPSEHPKERYATRIRPTRSTSMVTVFIVPCCHIIIP